MAIFPSSLWEVTSNIWSVTCASCASHISAAAAVPYALTATASKFLSTLCSHFVTPEGDKKRFPEGRCKWRRWRRSATLYMIWVSDRIWKMCGRRMAGSRRWWVIYGSKEVNFSMSICWDDGYDLVTFFWKNVLQKEPDISKCFGIIKTWLSANILIILFQKHYLRKMSYFSHYFTFEL